MTNEHTYLEKYTSHTLFERVAKGLCVSGELETEQTATYWPQVPLLGCSIRGPEGPSPLLGASFHCLELQLNLQLTDSNSNCLWFRVISFSDIHLLLVGVASAPNSIRTHVKVIPSTGCTCFSIDGLVEGQYVTIIP